MKSVNLGKYLPPMFLSFRRFYQQKPYLSHQECFYLAGYDSTMGLAQLIDRPATRDCSFVVGMKEQHAIPFCVTNIPQTMVSWSCSNPVYGNTLNPHDHSRTPGGSSGDYIQHSHWSRTLEC